MTKQIQIFSTEIDDKKIELFLRSNYNCVMFQSFAPAKDQLILADISITYHKYSGVHIWNKEFAWKPMYKQMITDEKLFYVSNKSGAPLIEFRKTNWGNNTSGGIYREKSFAASKSEYDLDKFDKFYNDIVKWIKKNAKGKIKYCGINCYYLEDAWKLFADSKRSQIIPY